jgi:hypothetical protein
VQPGEFLAFDPEALVFGQVPMQDIELNRRHCIEIPFEDVDRLVVAPYVNKKTPPGKAGTVINLDSGDEVTVAVTFKQLLESLEAPQDADRGWGLKNCLPLRYLKRVGFVFAN